MKAIPPTDNREAWAKKVLGLIQGCRLAIEQAHEELPLLQEICRLVVEMGGYPLASVSLLEENDPARMKRVAQAGVALGFLDLLPSIWEETGDQYPTGTALRTGQPVFCADIQAELAFAPYAEVAATIGLAACFALPLSHQGQVFGVLTLYAATPEDLSPDDREFLKTLTAFCCQGLTNRRLKKDLSNIKKDLADKSQWLASFPFPIFIFDLEGTILWLNQAVSTSYGFTPEELLGGNWLTLVPPNYQDLLADHRQRLISQGEAILESNHLRKDRTSFPVEIHSWIIDFKGDKAILSIGLDISERKLLEEILGETEEKYRIIFDQAQEGIFHWRLSDGRMLACNDRMAHILGYDAKEELLRDFVARHHFVEPDTTERMVEGGKDGRIHEFTTQLFRRDGTIVWLQFSARLDLDRDLMDGVAADVTELQKTKDSLTRITEQHQTLVENLLGRIVFISAEQQQLNKAIQQEKNFYEKILGHCKDGVAVFDQNLNITLWNPALEHFTGLSKNSALGRNLLKVLPFLKEFHEERPILEGGGHREVLRQDQPRRLTPTGPEGCYSGYMASLVNAGDEVGGGVIFIRNDTAVWRIEHSLKEQQDLLEGILTSLEDGVAVLDRDLTFVRLNPTIKKWFALDEPLLGKKCHAVIHGILDPCENCPALKTLVSGEPAQAVVPKWRNGEEEAGWMALFSHPLKDSSTGETVGVILRMQDITAKLRGEATLKESREFLKLVFNLLPVSIGRLEPEGTVTFGENTIEELTGYSPGEFAPGGKPWSAVILEEDREPARQVFLQALGTDRFYTREYRVRTKDGRIIWFQERGQITCDSQGRVLFTDILLLDVSEQKQREEVQAPRLETGLRPEPRLEAFGSLAAAIAHDFNNILGVMLGYAEMALMSLEEKDVLQRRLEQVLKAGKRGKELISQILSLSRPSPPERRLVHLNAIIKEALNTLQATLPSNIGFKMRLAEKQDTVLASPTQIHQVLISLCANSAQAMRDRGGLLEISVTLVNLDAEAVAQRPGLSPGRYLRLSIKDTGPGMDQETLEKIFEFSLSDEKIDKGISLGLAAVHSIIKAHKGIITVQSEVGKGTEFQIYFPWVEIGKVPGGVKALPVENGRQHLLLVDDEEWLVDMWKEILESLGYLATGTTSPLHVLHMVKEKPREFDLVILDHTMPQMTGLELAKELTSLQPGLPIILITSFSDLVSPEEGEMAGIQEYVMKPLSISELTNAITRVLEKKPLRKQEK